ncbi:hypothetical protein PVAND_017641 [Polypedilum vanderplanki]|uniref:Uncharacterized protein n=1 Tax=Polypedilum vanderplanki TaxID=319348 RepID=A0A9J6B8W7_POLVA|nr:hypothetical protein PVAND_017641 [Polypedilum vanderplanki]
MQQQREYASIWSAQIECMPINLSLTRILQQLQLHVRSMISIARVYDFYAKIPSDKIIISLLSYEEVSYLLENCSILFHNELVKAELIHSNLTSISNDHAEKYNFTQRSLMITNVNTKISKNEITNLLIQLSDFFEENLQVSGFRLIFDKRRIRLRSFAFIDCLSNENFSHFEGNQVSFGMETRWYKCMASSAVPILLKDADLILMNTNHNKIKRLLDANLLSCRISDPNIEPNDEFIRNRQVINEQGQRNIIIQVDNEEVSDESAAADILVIDEPNILDDED